MCVAMATVVPMDHQLPLIKTGYVVSNASVKTRRTYMSCLSSLVGAIAFTSTFTETQRILEIFL